MHTQRRHRSLAIPLLNGSHQSSFLSSVFYLSLLIKSNQVSGKIFARDYVIWQLQENAWKKNQKKKEKNKEEIRFKLRYHSWFLFHLKAKARKCKNTDKIFQAQTSHLTHNITQGIVTAKAQQKSWWEWV